MARQNSAQEFNTFVRGLITEASPLTNPENCSIDERNFVLEKRGSRRRRLGLDFEAGNNGNFYGTGTNPGIDYPVSTFTWENAGGTSEDLVFVQNGVDFSVFRSDGSNLYGSLFASFQVEPGVLSSEVTPGFKATYAVVSDVLVIASGDDDLTVVEYDGTDITTSKKRIKIRDTFGVPAEAAAFDSVTEVGYRTANLREGNDIGLRPATIFMIDPGRSYHLYNLRNQGWAIPRREFETNDIKDPLQTFENETAGQWFGGLFPSNSDQVISHLFPNAEAATGSRVGDRFSAESATANLGGTFEAPRGHYIIDLLARSESRLEAIEIFQRGALPPVPAAYQINSLPEDYSPGGVGCVESYAGRLWYTNFDGRRVTEQLEYSPGLSSYVAFSQLVKSPADVGKCYQEGDPTAKEDSDLLDTDGGLITIDGADRILFLKKFQSSLLVFATNGVWKISGGSDYGFTATDYRVDKISYVGAIASGPVVETDNSVVYWSEDGIYLLAPDQVGATLTSQSLSKATIQSYFNSIPYEDKIFADGIFDRYDRKVRWLFGNRIGSTDVVRELVFDVDLGAFYINEMSNNTSDHPICAAYVRVPSYSVSEDLSLRIPEIRETKYVIILETEEGQAKQFSFALMRDPDFVDWASNFRADPVEFESYLITGIVSGAEFQRNKQVPYLTMHFTRTENGFEEVDGDIVPTRQSGCKVQARFDWAIGPEAQGWGREFQAYRYRRHYIPEDVNDDYSTGEAVITTKNKIRGKGKSVYFLMKSEPRKDCRILGWSMIMGISGNV